MMNPAPVLDEESLLRHIPPGGTTPTAAGIRVNSDNFRLRKGETGVSVSRAGMTTVTALIARVGGDLSAGSVAPSAEVAAVRALGLEVVPVLLDDDSGHAEIRSASADLEDRKLRRRLAELFRPLDAASG